MHRPLFRVYQHIYKFKILDLLICFPDTIIFREITSFRIHRDVCNSGFSDTRLPANNYNFWRVFLEKFPDFEVWACFHKIPSLTFPGQVLKFPDFPGFPALYTPIYYFLSQKHNHTKQNHILITSKTIFRQNDTANGSDHRSRGRG